MAVEVYDAKKLKREMKAQARRRLEATLAGMSKDEIAELYRFLIDAQELSWREVLDTVKGAK